MTAHRSTIALLAIVLTGVLSGAAHAAGPPLPSSASGRAGAVAPGADDRLLARASGRDTIVTAVRRGNRTVLRSRRIAGRWSVPAVTLYGGTTGLSADGTTLVLARPTRSFPPTSTRLAVVDARTLKLRRTIALEGFFTVDAISPDGGLLYAIQYPGHDVFDYRVRALDTATGRLAAADIVDPRNPDEQMGGLPMTRAVSRDGRWAYTLYAGGRETFIHALDTVGRTAACVDLDMVSPDRDMSAVRLALSGDGGRIHVRDAGELGQPGAGVEALASPSSGAFPWLALVLVGAAAGGVLAAVRIRRRRRVAVAR